MNIYLSVKYHSFFVILICRIQQQKISCMLSNSFTLLKKYYQGQSTSAFNLLKQEESLRELLEPKYLIFILRYVENINLTPCVQTIKTLMLFIRLYRLQPLEIRQLLNQHIPTLNPDPQEQAKNIVTIIYSKMLKFFNSLLSDPSMADHPNQQQLLILTSHLNLLKQSLSNNGDDVHHQLCQQNSWIVEEQLCLLWKNIENQLHLIDQFDKNTFEMFYQEYSLFCTHRRKIPVIKHRGLKSIRITTEINQAIEQKRKQLKEEAEKKEIQVLMSAGRRQLTVFNMESSDQDQE